MKTSTGEALEERALMAAPLVNALWEVRERMPLGARDFVVKLHTKIKIYDLTLISERQLEYLRMLAS